MKTSQAQERDMFFPAKTANIFSQQALLSYVYSLPLHYLFLFIGFLLPSLSTCACGARPAKSDPDRH